MTEEHNYFTDLAKIDVSNYVEKKGQFSYLSWAWAVDVLKRYDPDASWTVKRFPNPAQTEIELPYMITPKGSFVEVEVTVKGRTVSQLQPVMDFRNKAMTDPDVMDVNKAIQRCIVKGIALHGLGLYIYAGEDIPNDIASPVKINKVTELATEFGERRGRTLEATLTHLGVQSVNHLKDSQADIVLEKLSGWIKKLNEEEAAKEAEDKPDGDQEVGDSNDQTEDTGEQS